MPNEIAPNGQIWVCAACGKRSKDRYGNQSLNYGWDESCFLNSFLCHEDKLIIENNLVVKDKTCRACKGTGVDPKLHERHTSGGHDDRSCEACQGSGRID